MWDREIEDPGRQDIVEVKPDIYGCYDIRGRRGERRNGQLVRSGLSATLETDR